MISKNSKPEGIDKIEYLWMRKFCRIYSSENKRDGGTSRVVSQ